MARRKKTYSRAQKMAKKRIGTGTAKKPNRSIKSIKAANQKSMRDAASARHKKFKQTRVQTFGGKKTSFSKSEQKRITDANYSVSGYSKAKPNEGKPASAKSSPRFNAPDTTLLASERRINPFNIFQTQDAIKEGDAAREGVRPKVDNPGFLDGILNRNSETQRMINELGSLTTPTFGLTASTSPMAIRTYGTGGVTEDASSASGYSRDGEPLTKTEAMSTFGIGGLNLDNVGGTERALPTGNPDVMSSDGTFNRPGPTPEDTPESDYTSYQPGSFYNQSDTNMNPTNFLRSTRNLITSPARMLGINNRFTNMLIPKSDEAIQDARDNRGPAPTLTKPKSRGARITQPTVQEEFLLPVEQPVQTASTTGTTQTGVDSNRLLQIQQQAYKQAYNPMSIGGFNPQFRFASRTPSIDYSTYFNYS